MSATNQGAFYGGRQFLRFTEVMVKDFKKNTKTLISDNFEIEFEYFKTLDQTQEDDSGKVTIYGLKDETIELLEQEGGEVWLRCGYLGAYIDTLFVAYISKVSSVKQNNTSVTTIECSANLMTHFFSGYAIADVDVTVPLLGLLKNLGTSLGFGNTEFNIDNVPKDSEQEVLRFLNTYSTKNYRLGDLRTILESTCDAYGLQFQRALVDGADSAVFSFTELGLKKTLKRISDGYPAIDINNQALTDASALIARTWDADEGLDAGVVLTKETGLISSETEYQIITAFADQKLNANEEETEESVYNRLNPSEKKPKKRGGSDSEVAELLARTESPSYGASGGLGDGFVSNSVLSGLKIKGGVGGQATQGGRVRGYTADFATIVQNEVKGDLVYFSGFNDRHHVNKGGQHPVGQAFDLTLKSGKFGAAGTAAHLRQVAVRKGFKVKILDEYNFPAEGSTGGHLHVSVYGRIGSESGTVNENGGDISRLDDSDIGGNEDYYGRTPIEINRKYNKITTLLNPVVKPQSLVFTKDKKSKDYLIHRVRHATYKGNNKRGDWTMVLYCEDTETKKITPEEPIAYQNR